MAAKEALPEAMSNIVLFDTSVIIDQIRTNRHLDRLMNIDGLIRNSSVVLAELWRGARHPVDRLTVEALERNHPILVPTQSHWVESGRVLARIGEEKGFDAGKLRDLHFDVLIALTARSHGARLITSNRADFELVREYRDFKLEVW